jgi:hypothetical protein
LRGGLYFLRRLSGASLIGKTFRNSFTRSYRV